MPRDLLGKQPLAANAGQFLALNGKILIIGTHPSIAEQQATVEQVEGTGIGRIAIVLGFGRRNEKT